VNTVLAEARNVSGHRGASVTMAEGMDLLRDGTDLSVEASDPRHVDSDLPSIDADLSSAKMFRHWRRAREELTRCHHGLKK
jgi:hypothetical protein